MDDGTTGFWGKVKRLNWTILASTLVLTAVGVLFVKSAGSSRQSVEIQQLWLGQLGFALVGLAFMAVLAFWDYRRWTAFAPWIYGGVLVALVLVLVPGIGVERLGARRWLWGLQPSEPAKLAVIVILAWILGRGGARMRGLGGLLLCGLLAGVPALLILVEPDLGSMLVLAPTALAMLFAARVAPAVLRVGVLMAVFAVGYELALVKVAAAEGCPPERREMLITWTGLRDHQVRRVETFLYPMRDLHASGYNAYQSEIAVGSGGVHGKGYGKGVQHRLGYLPEMVAINDFIFPVFAEEMGFVGAAVLLAFYFLGLILPGMIVAARCVDDLGRLLCTGVVTLLFCHVFINIGMTVRIVPITGLPLPFISQGGTFMLVMMVAMGILQSVAVHGRNPGAMFRN